jgi:hypothetical protein
MRIENRPMVAGAAIREEGAMICATPVGSALR